MPLDQDVEHREGEVCQELPDFSSKEHPQDSVWIIDLYPAPAHRHFWCIVTNFVERQGGDSDDQRNAPAAKHNKAFGDETLKGSKVNFAKSNSRKFVCKCFLSMTITSATKTSCDTMWEIISCLTHVFVTQWKTHCRTGLVALASRSWNHKMISAF